MMANGAAAYAAPLRLFDPPSQSDTSTAGFGIPVAKLLSMKKNSKPTSGDRHTSRFMVRLPEIFRSKLRLLHERTGKPITQLIQSALKMFLKRFGFWSQQDERELKRQLQTGLNTDNPAF
jgi:hypothetical protein